MNKLLIIIGCLLLAGCSAHSHSRGPQVGKMPEGVCTMDFNPWGKASQCFCPEGETYDQRAGLCFKHDSNEMITVQGVLTAGMVAIGGETTGFELKTLDGASYELILKVSEQEKLQKLSGQSFEVTGNFIIINSAERDDRKAIVVDSLNSLD